VCCGWRTPSTAHSNQFQTCPWVDGGGWSTPRPGTYNPGKDPVPIVQEDGWVTGPVWTGAENLTPTRIRSPDPTARSESLYRRSFPAHTQKWYLSFLSVLNKAYHGSPQSIKKRRECNPIIDSSMINFFSYLVKTSHYRPGQALRFPGG
jgi:hypothetical protein